MIFVALGTQKFQFNRLLEKLDMLIESGKIQEEVFAQVGNSDYIPKTYNYIAFLDKCSFQEKIEACSLLITHSGVGTIITGIKNDKPVIVLPRLKRYGEHVDDHQVEIAEAFSKKDYIFYASDENELYNLIQESRENKPAKYVSQQEKIIKVINNFLQK